MDQRAFAACEDMVRTRDPDRYFSALFAPAARRPFLFALYAFNHEVARVAESVSDPMLGRIRLEWWRETVEGAKSGAPRAHDVARTLAETFRNCDLPLGTFEALVAAREFDASPEIFPDIAALEAYVDATSGNLMRLAVRVLGSDMDVRDAALAYGLCGLLRSVGFHARRRKLYLPMDLVGAVDLSPEEIFTGQGGERLEAATAQIALRARDHYRAARKMPRPHAGLPALLLAALVPLYLRRLAKGKDAPLHRRQIALLGASMRGRI